MNILNKDSNIPSLVISLDFEMRWGVHDIYKYNIDSYKKNLENVKLIVPKILKMFDQRSLKATWATVGALACENWEEYFKFAPQSPNYENHKLKITRKYAEIDPIGSLHFAPDLIRLINKTRYQDLGSHGFSHLYFKENGITHSDFINDLNAVQKIFEKKFNHTPISFVFPRNQIAFINHIQKTSIKTWRSNEKILFYNNNYKNKSKIVRLLRIVDSINPLTIKNNYVKNEIIPSTMFLRYNLPDLLWKLQVKKIKNQLLKAKPYSVIHFWWHPHNLGNNINNNFFRLEEILEIFSNFLSKNIICSKNMADYAK